MADYKYSAFLELILEKARLIARESEVSAVTGECVLVSFIDFLQDQNVMQIVEKDVGQKAEYEATYALLKEYFGNLNDLRQQLVGFMQKNRGSAVADSLSFKKILFMAGQKMKESTDPVLSANTLLKYILAEPSAGIEQALNRKKTPETVPAQPRVPDILQELFNNTHAETAAMRPEMERQPELESQPKMESKEPSVPGASGSVGELAKWVKNIQRVLLDTVYGQENAIQVLTSGLFQAELLAMTDKSRKRPKASFLFAGPPGVGKTFLAEKAAEVLGLPFMRFDMSEYSDKESSIEFCGADGVYKDSKSGNVTEFVSENPKCVLLFDEIEKAHINVIHLFLQMLDAGRLRDSRTDKEIPFSDVIMIFTTNAGRQLYEDADSANLSGLSRKVILNALQKDVNPATGAPFFPAAICSRFASGNVVMFNHIEANNLWRIAKREMERHAGNLEKETGIRVSFHDDVYTTLLFSEGGAADARTIRARSEAFFNNELFELYRLLENEKYQGMAEQIREIRFSVDRPVRPDLLTLFEEQQAYPVLLFGSKEAAQAAANNRCEILQAEELALAEELLKDRDIRLILCDALYGMENADEKKVLHSEDIRSKGRDFLHYALRQHPEIPVYLIQREGQINADEEISFRKTGVQGIVRMGKDSSTVSDQLSEICTKIHQQQGMLSLSRSNRLVTFETAQSLAEGSSVAEIRLFDLKPEVAVDAGDSENILSNLSRPDVHFSDVIGAEDAKKELQYFVEYLKNPKKFRGTGVRAPRGVLLYGPPGTGKTMLAKAMAGESEVTFITAEGNQFLKSHVGEGPESVHELFRTARKYAPTILFVDEIDAIAKERRGGEMSHASEEILTAFLTEMDGFKNDAAKPVFVLAATNFDVEPGGAKSLDPALMRRFDRRLFIDLPTKEERIRYLKKKAESLPIIVLSEEKLENIATRSTGMSLAALESVVELALRSAIRDGEMKVTDAIFDEAFETFNSGETKHWDRDQLERVARHEAGHAYLCWLNGEIPSYLTIVARGSHGGYMQHADKEGKAIYTKEEVLALIRVSLGGRAAELVYYGPEDGISTGASGDLAGATNRAMHMLCSYGMDPDFGLAVVDEQAAQTGAPAVAVQKAVNQILDREMKKAIDLIAAGKKQIDALVEELLKKDHLTGAEIDEILKSV